MFFCCAKSKIGLSGNALKLLAAFLMVTDHVGMLLLPQYAWLRYFGRIAYPIFAFFIAEGCYYTKNKTKYLAQMLALGLIFHAVYSIATEDFYSVNVLVSFALATCFIYLFQWMSDAFADNRTDLAFGYLAFFVCLAVLCFFLCKTVHIEYRFFGLFLPLFCYFSRKKSVRLLFFFFGILLVALGMGTDGIRELFALLAVPLIALYNGERGTLKMKYFFYIFYPLHIVVLYGISILIYGY